MPIFEYACESCGRRFEKIQKLSDPPPETCPHCGGPVHKVMSAPAIQFKGSGWYITDYAKKDSSGTKSGDSAEPTSTKEAPPKDASPKDASTKEAGGDKSSTAKKTESTSTTTNTSKS